MGTKHALLSPSSAYRWIHCPPSVLLEQQFADTTSSAAEEGTVAHAYCEHKLKRALKMQSKRPVSTLDCDEMQEHTDDYVHFVLGLFEEEKQKGTQPHIYIEERVDVSTYVPNGFGTADCMIATTDCLYIIDFKYGKGIQVDALENPQMKCYALGALSSLDFLYDFTKVVMIIFQPRLCNISRFETSPERLITWGRDVLSVKAKEALAGEGEYCSGDWCRFCRASSICRARSDMQLELAKYEFRVPPTLRDDEIADILAMSQSYIKWIKDIEQYALTAAVQQGKKWNGYKLVEGRSIRKYVDEDTVISTLNSHGYTDIFRRSLLTITEMEKLLGKKRCNELLGKFIIKPKGKPTLVPISDKREAIQFEHEFKEED